MTNQTLPLGAIRTDGKTQARVQLDESAVDDYSASYSAKAPIPPVVVFFDGVECWLADGFHRFFAARKAGLNEINCHVHEGTKQDAVWFACAANATHGLRRTQRDKARAVELALRHEKGATLSDRQIADHVGVDHKTVARVRDDLARRGEIPHVEKRTDAVGRQQPASKPSAAKPTPTPPCPCCGSVERDEHGECPKCHDPCERADHEPKLEPRQRPARMDADSPPSPVDDQGNDVPEHLWPVFERRRDFGRLAQAAKEIAVEWRKLCESPAGHFIDEADAEGLEEFARQANAGRPALLCDEDPGWAPNGLEYEE